MKKSLGLFGIGRWGKNVARNFSELGVLNSIYDPFVKNEVKENFSDCVFCENEDEIFANPNIDKVAIVTRIPDHTRLIIKALKSNKDVFVEKPICFDLKDAQYIKSLAKQKKRIVMVGHLLHYHPAVVKLKELISQNEIGDIISVDATRISYGYIKEEMNSLWGLATHDISLILSLIPSSIDSVLAVSQGMFDFHGEDIYNCFINFSNNVKAHIKVNWLNPYKEQKFVVTGTNGLLLFDDTAKWEEKLKLFYNPIYQSKNNTINSKQKDNFVYIKFDSEEPLKNECKYFLNCCSTRIDPFTNVDESMRVIEVIKSLINSVNGNQCLPLIKDYFLHKSSSVENSSTILNAQR